MTDLTGKTARVHDQRIVASEFASWLAGRAGGGASDCVVPIERIAVPRAG